MHCNKAFFLILQHVLIPEIDCILMHCKLLLICQAHFQILLIILIFKDKTYLSNKERVILNHMYNGFY